MKKLPPWVVLLAAAAYVISPVDLVPDIPIVGWADDAMVALLALLHTAISARRGRTIEREEKPVIQVR